MDKISYKSHTGRTYYSLIHQELGLIEEYSIYIESLGLAPQNTIDNVAQDLKKFFEYLYAFSELSNLADLTLNSTALSSLILAFPTYLALGKNGEGIAAEIAKITKINPTGYVTNSRILSSVRGFIKESALFHDNLLALKNEGLIDIDVEPSTLFKELTVKRRLNSAEQKALINKSMMAGVISGGPKYIRSNLFKTRGISSDDNPYKKAFPFNSVEDVISQATTYRDRCLWALLAGTGIRGSEGTQLLLRDVNAKERTLFIIDPEKRLPVYASCPHEWINELDFKGREIDTVYFIEPFKTIFFDNLPKLLLERKKKNCSHQFLFITMDSGHDSRPLFLADNKSLNGVFRTAQNRMGLESDHTLHSLRHFYAAWCVNYIPLGNGRYGMSTSTVQTLMGHASEESTKKYSVKDELILEATINMSNALIEQSRTCPENIVREAINYRLSKVQERFLGIKSEL